MLTAKISCEQFELNLFCDIVNESQRKGPEIMSLRTDQYKVVINHEEQYSLIPTSQAISRGWREVGKTGTQSECLKYIEEVWTDMKPGDMDRLRRSITR